MATLQFGEKQTAWDKRAQRRVYNWRITHNWSQRELAEKIGRNAIWINRFEAGLHTASLGTLAALAAAFNRTLFDLLELPADAAEQEMVERVRAMADETRAALLVWMRQLTPHVRPDESDGKSPSAHAEAAPNSRRLPGARPPKARQAWHGR